jgi:glycosidase
VIDRGTYGYQTVNVDAQLRDEQSLFNRLRRLVAIRKEHTAFSNRISRSSFGIDLPSLQSNEMKVMARSFASTI